MLNLGCGTGMLTVTFACGGRSVVGVDPWATMLGCARRRANADEVSWIHGDSRTLPFGALDYAVMTGNVAQHVQDAEWNRTLCEPRQSLTVGGTLNFESRNPAVRAWENWSAHTTRETVTEALVLVFRDRATIEHQLVAAGFVIDEVYGGWDRIACTDRAQVMGWLIEF